MLNLELLRDIIQDWVKAGCGSVDILDQSSGETVSKQLSSVIWREKNRPQPVLPFGSLQILSNNKVGIQSSRFTPPATSDGAKMFIENMHSMSISFQAYGPGAMNFCQNLIDYREKPTSLNKLVQKQIDILSIKTLTVGAVYYIKIFDVGSYYTAISGDTKISVAAKLVAAVNANVDIMRGMSIAVNSTNTERITIQARTGDQFYLQHSSNIESFSHQDGYHIAIEESNGARNLGGIVDNQAMERANVDIFIAAMFIDIDEPGVIESAQVAVGVLDGDNETIITINEPE
jgi:hypothetical protein